MSQQAAGPGRRVLVVDVGGTNVKLYLTGEDTPRRFPSGKRMTPDLLVAGVREAASGWSWDVISLGYPGPVRGGRPVVEPHNLAAGWVGFDFARAFGCPVKILNDAAMQALGSYRGGTMLFLGFGTGLGSTLIVNGTLVPMELAHLPWEKGTFEDYLGARGLEKRGKREWRKRVAEVIARFTSALFLDDVVLGGGNARKLKELPPGCRLGDNANVFDGGYRLWQDAGE
jgi:polyphosphate glucokinase